MLPQRNSAAQRLLAIATKCGQRQIAIQTYVTCSKPNQGPNDSAGSPPNMHQSTDRRHDVLKSLLYETPSRQLPELTEADKERHQTIIRATKLYASEKQRAMREERERKFRAMQNAFEELRLTDNTLFEHANKKESNITFPRQMRRPVDTPPAAPIWKY